MNSKMNVIFIMTDQQRADSFGDNKSKYSDFPNMEALRKESLSFDNFYTCALPCVPSRYSFLTGRQPWMGGIHGNAKFAMGDSNESWMGVLRNNGYRCVSVGKTHMIHEGSFHIPVDVRKTFSQRGAGWDHFNIEASPELEENYFDIAVANKSCEVLTELNKSEDPFALFIGFHAPHEPYVMPEKYTHFLSPEDVELPEARRDNEYEAKSEAYRKRVDHFKKMFGEIDEGMAKTGIAGYYCMLKMIDDCLGNIMDKIRSLDLLKNTLIVFTSDHGELLYEHNIFNKSATFYEGEVRIPFMIRFPDLYKAGGTVQDLSTSLDFVPTLLDILKVNADVSYPGYSMMNYVDGDGKPREYVTSWIEHSMMLRTDKYKLWYNHLHGDGELYDLEKDPMELNNLYGNKEYEALQGQLFQLMMHSRMRDDFRNNLPTKREQLLKSEVKSSREPEVV